MKKNLPLVFREALENMLVEHIHLLDVKIEDGPTIMITEKNDPDSPFRFIIWGGSKKGGLSLYSINYRPTSIENANQTLHQNIPLGDISTYLDTWIGLIERYNQPSKVFDDPITQSYYNDITSKVKIIDEDADTAPFNYEQQTLLMNLYDVIKEQVKKEQNETNSKEAEAIILEIESAQSRLSRETKNQATERFYKIAAKGMKYSYYIIKLIAEGLLVGTAIKLLTGGAL